VTSLDEHPLRLLRDAGVLQTVNTDDPALMGWDLGREYAALGRAQGFDLQELARIAVEGIASTWLDASDRAALRRAFQAGIDAILAPTASDTPTVRA
jgi:adenosine deaminase